MARTWLHHGHGPRGHLQCQFINYSSHRDAVCVVLVDGILHTPVYSAIGNRYGETQFCIYIHMIGSERRLKQNYLNLRFWYRVKLD